MPKKKAKEWFGWHFLPEDRRTRWGGKLVRKGTVIRASGPLVLCENGVHASAKALDALAYAPGPVVCWVRLGGKILHGEDKSVARERKCLAIADAWAVLRLFACWCAERALRAERTAGREPDKRSWEAIRVARQFARSKATATELAAAYAAADVARVAAGAAADVARVAAYVAADVAAYVARAAADVADASADVARVAAYVAADVAADVAGAAADVADASAYVARAAADVAAYVARAAAYAAADVACVAAGAAADVARVAAYAAADVARVAAGAAADVARVAAYAAARLAQNRKLTAMLRKLLKVRT